MCVICVVSRRPAVRGKQLLTDKLAEFIEVLRVEHDLVFVIDLVLDRDQSLSVVVPATLKDVRRLSGVDVGEQGLQGAAPEVVRLGQTIGASQLIVGDNLRLTIIRIVVHDGRNELVGVQHAQPVAGL